ncbi:MAG: hypothetical protein HYZ27_02495, partial [Deltaproteobacteria bacterium]|nr:hypothetical protein [Deltaproteobacteria bacterium]
PLGIRQPRRWWVAVLGLNVLLVLVLNVLPEGMAPQIDVAAHAGGLLAGAGVALVLLPPRHLLRAAPTTPPLTYSLALGLIALNLWGLGQAVLYAARFDAAAERQALEVLIDDARVDANSLNVLAWTLATDPLRDQEDLALAARAAERAVAALPAEPAYRDTLATIRHRQGQHDEAVDLERQALVDGAQAFYATQLARFLEARVKAGGEVARGVDDQALVLSMAPSGTTIKVEAPRPPAKGLLALAVVREDERPAALVEIRVGTGFRGPEETALKNLPEWATPERLRVHLLLMEALDGAPAGLRSRFWPADPAVRELP